MVMQEWRAGAKAGKSRLAPAALALPSELTNCALAAMSYERRDFDTAQGLMELSQWAPLQQGSATHASTDTLAVASDGCVLRALLAKQRVIERGSRYLLSSQMLLPAYWVSVCGLEE